MPSIKVTLKPKRVRKKGIKKTKSTSIATPICIMEAALSKPKAFKNTGMYAE